MAKIFKTNNKYVVQPDNSVQLLDKLETGVYHVHLSTTGFFLTKDVYELQIPNILFGDVKYNMNRVFNTFMSKDSNTGVLLSGEKGSGKTMLAKLLSKHCYKHDIPTIIIDKYYPGIAEFVSTIDQKALVLIDEFEKVCGHEDAQNEFLTMLDGTHVSNKLFLFTVNNTYYLSQYLINRPGRVHYHIKFNGVDEKFIVEYCNEELDNKEYIQDIVSISKLVNKFNFDMLKSIVFECNLYKDSPIKLAKILNINIDNVDSMFDFEIKDNKTGHVYTGKINANLFGSNSIYLNFYFSLDNSSKSVVDNLFNSNFKDNSDDEKYIDEYLFFKLDPENYCGYRNGYHSYKANGFDIKLSKAKLKEYSFLY